MEMEKTKKKNEAGYVKNNKYMEENKKKKEADTRCKVKSNAWAG